MSSHIGFLGLGLMGEPIALNLARAGVPLLVWNRTAERTEPLRAAGATVAATADDVFADSEIVIAMLAHAEAIDEVLGRRTPRFTALMRDRTFVHMGTTAPAYSAALGAEIAAAGGAYVEAPVSGSRVPAQRGELAGMVAGKPADVARVRPLLRHVCSEIVECGAVPNALTTKLAVNIFLITLVTGLAESFHFAAESGLDLAAFARVLDSGPMASAVSRLKLDKLLRRDFGAQAALADVLQNNVLIREAAAASGIATPLIETCRDLFAEATQLAIGAEDMVGVVHAHESRTAAQQHKEHR
jgi:3-hydroxyisobutyrate dehydrogenase